MTRHLSLFVKNFRAFQLSATATRKALREAQTALDLMVETYREKGIPLPEPKTVLLEAA
jgi:hypothetical protein